MGARMPPGSGLFALNREISVCVRLRGGVGRTRTSNQAVIVKRWGKHGAAILPASRRLPKNRPPGVEHPVSRGDCVVFRRATSRQRRARASRHDLAAVGIISVNAPVTAPKMMPRSTLSPPALAGRSQALRTVIFLFRSNSLMGNAEIFIYFPPKPLKCYVKHVTLNQRVQGSSPCAPTTKKIIFCYRWSFGVTALTF
jgi:hypothetical protein